MIDIVAINQLHQEMVQRWHLQPIDNPYTDELAIICTQHSFNFQLWHEEDVARSPDVSDTRIAEVKRKIDKFNQQRNDWIEKIDDWISDQLQQRENPVDESAPLNTETPGSAIDRLSIMSLRLYHLHEQLERTDVDAGHLESVERKIAVCRMQQDDLSGSLRQLMADILSGKKRHRTYRQFKMYNDPKLNPYLYQAKQRVAN